MKYVIDTSTLRFAKTFYPPTNAKKFWEKLHDLNIEGKLIILDEIKNELKKGGVNDYLKSDFLEGKDITSTNFPEIPEILEKIGNEVRIDQREGFRAWLKKADPYLIAYAYYLKEKGEDVMVLHNEAERGNKLKIDIFCHKYGLLHGKIDKLINNENIELA